jgi:hypothetical protein
MRIGKTVGCNGGGDRDPPRSQGRNFESGEFEKIRRKRNPFCAWNAPELAKQSRYGAHVSRPTALGVRHSHCAMPNNLAEAAIFPQWQQFSTRGASRQRDN